MRNPESEPSIDEFNNPSVVLPKTYKNLDQAVDSHKKLENLNTKYNFKTLALEEEIAFTVPQTKRSTSISDKEIADLFPINEPTGKKAS